MPKNNKIEFNEYFYLDDFGYSLNSSFNISNFTTEIQYSPMLTIVEQIGDYLSFYYTPFLVFFGSIGNILSVIVLFKTNLRKLSSSYYLAGLAISDTCFLFGLFVQWLNFIDIDIYNRNIFCQFFTFFSSLCSFLSVWFVVAFTVERFIAVVYPLRRQSMCTVRRAKQVLCGLTSIGSCHCLPFIFFSSPIFDQKLSSTLCDIKPKYKHYMTVMNYIDTIVVFAVPFATIVVLNICIGYTVWKFAMARNPMMEQRLTTSICKSNSSNHRSGSEKTTFLRDRNRQSFTSRKKIPYSSQIKVTKMLLIVSTVFICLNLPSYVIRIRAFLETDVSKATIVIQYICWFLFLTNFGINFLLYCVSGQNFRKAVVSMFKKMTRTSQRETYIQSTATEYERVKRSRRKTNNSNTSC